MKYFTRELWESFQNTETFDQCDKIWIENLKKYNEQLDSLQSRFNKDAFHFIKEESIHDGNLVSFEVINVNELNRVKDKTYKIKRRIREPISVVIKVLSEGILYELYYSLVKNLNVKFSGESDLFQPYFRDFGDWGYDEVTSINDKVLCHEILFSSGAEIHIEFEKMKVKRTRVIK
jgi:hypothetical protein